MQLSSYQSFFPNANISVHFIRVESESRKSLLKHNQNNLQQIWQGMLACFTMIATTLRNNFSSYSYINK